MTTTAAATRATTGDDITREVLRRFEQTTNPRLREIMLSLVTHLHGFATDVSRPSRNGWPASSS